MQGVRGFPAVPYVISPALLWISPTCLYIPNISHSREPDFFSQSTLFVSARGSMGHVFAFWRNGYEVEMSLM